MVNTATHASQHTHRHTHTAQHTPQTPSTRRAHAKNTLTAYTLITQPQATHTVHATRLAHSQTHTDGRTDGRTEPQHGQTQGQTEPHHGQTKRERERQSHNTMKNESQRMLLPRNAHEICTVRENHRNCSWNRRVDPFSRTIGFWSKPWAPKASSPRERTDTAIPGGAVDNQPPPSFFSN